MIVRDDGSLEEIPEPPQGFCRVCGDPSGRALPDAEAINKMDLQPRGAPIPRREPISYRCLGWSARAKIETALRSLRDTLDREMTRRHGPKCNECARIFCREEIAERQAVSPAGWWRWIFRRLTHSR